MFGLAKQLTTRVGFSAISVAPAVRVNPTTTSQQFRESGYFARKNKKTAAAIRNHRKKRIDRGRNHFASPFDGNFLCDLKTFRKLPSPKFIYSEIVQYYKPAPNHEKLKSHVMHRPRSLY